MCYEVENSMVFEMFKKSKFVNVKKLAKIGKLRINEKFNLKFQAVKIYTIHEMMIILCRKVYVKISEFSASIKTIPLCGK